MSGSVPRFQGDSWTTKHHRIAMHAGEFGVAAGIALMVAGITLVVFMGASAAVWAFALILMGPLVLYISVIVTASYLERIEPARYVHES